MNWARVWKRGAVVVSFATALSGLPNVADAEQRHRVRGLVLSVDRSGPAFVVSHEAVSGVMPAMTMPFDVRDAGALDGIDVGTTVEFTMVADERAVWAEQVRVRPYETAEQDPLTAGRLRLLADIQRPPASPRMVAAGQPVPDFTLSNQATRPISLSALRGRVVLVNFIYTSCALPQFCYRTANHFGALQRRFEQRLGNDLVFLTVTFDPAVDRPDVLAKYAAQWRPAAGTWHFLTGEPAEVHAVCDLFGVDFFPDEGLMSHTVRTAIIDRQGVLVANIEGNRYTSRQLGDLVATVMDR